MKMRGWLVVVGLSVFGSTAAGAGGTSSIVVDVTGAVGTDGALICRLMGSNEGAPGATGVITDQHASVAAATCRFDHVVPGTYAVAVMHDRNANGALDAGDGLALSNDSRGPFPTWADTSFSVGPGQRTRLAVALRY